MLQVTHYPKQTEAPPLKSLKFVSEGELRATIWAVETIGQFAMDDMLLLCELSEDDAATNHGWSEVVVYGVVMSLKAKLGELGRGHSFDDITCRGEDVSLIRHSMYLASRLHPENLRTAADDYFQARIREIQREIVVIDTTALQSMPAQRADSPEVPRIAVP